VDSLQEAVRAIKTLQRLGYKIDGLTVTSELMGELLRSVIDKAVETVILEPPKIPMKSFYPNTLCEVPIKVEEKVAIT
jgi:hypothetical protein